MTPTTEPSVDPGGVALGVDGGASAMKFAVRGSDGTVTHTRLPGANPSLIGMDSFLDRTCASIVEVLDRSGRGPEDVASAGFGLSGVDRPDQIAYIASELRRRVLTRCNRIWIGNDAIAALRLGAGRVRGLVLVAGTGSICLAAVSLSRVARVGGWGGELSDEGSGSWIGNEALRAACRMADGRRDRTVLLDGVLGGLELASAAELIPWSSALTREEFKHAMAALFPCVVDLARADDPVAGEILDAGADHLARHTEAAYRHFEAMRKETESEPHSIESVDLVCTGGLLTECDAYHELLVEKLRRRLQVVRPIRLTEPPALGALALGEEADPREPR